MIPAHVERAIHGLVVTANGPFVVWPWNRIRSHVELPPGDVTAFGYVMSNRPDAECRALVANAYRNCAPGRTISSNC